LYSPSPYTTDRQLQIDGEKTEEDRGAATGPVAKRRPVVSTDVSQMKQTTRTDIMLVRQLVVHRADTRVLPDDVRRHLVQRCLCVHIRMYMFHVHRRTEYICTGDMRQGGSDGSDCQIRVSSSANSARDGRTTTYIHRRRLTCTLALSSVANTSNVTSFALAETRLN
jgi:hypothetical protein